MNKILRLYNWLDRRDKIFGITIWILLTLIFFSKFLISGDPFSASDILLDFYPWKSVAYQTYVRPSNDLRIDDVFLNYPDLVEIKKQASEGNLATYTDKKLSGEVQYGFTYPYSPFFWPYFIFEANWSITISLMFRFFVCGLGMYFLLRKFKFGRFASIFAGIAFCGSTPFFSWINTPISATFATLPWTIFFLLKLFEKTNFRKQLLYILLAGLTIGISYIPGHFPSNFIYNIIFGIFFFGLMVSKVEGKFFSKLNIKFFIKKILQFVFVNILGLIYATVSLYPFVSKLLESSLINRGITSPGEILSPLFILSFFVPNIFGNPADRNWSYIGNFNEYIVFLGITTLILIPFALFSIKKNKLGLISLILALLTFGLFFNLPIINYLNVTPITKQIPSQRWAIALVFSLAILSALGIDCLAKSKNNFQIFIKKNFRKMLMGISTVGLMAVALIFTLVQNKIQHFLESEKFSYRILYISVALITFISVLVVIFMYIFKNKKHALYLLFPILLFELLLWSFHFHPTEDEKYIFPETPGLEYLTMNQDNSRVMFINGDDMFMAGNIPEAYGIRAVSGYDLFINVSYQEYLYGACKIYDFTPTNYLMPSSRDCMFSELSDMLDIKYFVLSPKSENVENFLTQGNESVKLVYKGDDMIIFQNTDNYGGGWFVENVIFSRATYLDYKEINEYKIDLRKTAIADTIIDSGKCINKISSFSRSTNKNTYELETSCDIFFVTNEKYDKSWHVYIDGVEISVVKVNHIFLGFEVHKGAKNIELIYRNYEYEKAFYISVTTAFVLIDLVVIIYFIENRRIIAKRKG